MDYAIRPMTIEDFDEVTRLWAGTAGVGLNESDSRVAIEAYLVRNPGLSLTAWRPDGRLVGAVLCGHDGRRGMIYHLAVAADCRRQGLARAMLTRCLAGLGAAGIHKCNIYVYADNHEGQAFWTHNGWSGRLDLCVLQKPTQ